MIIVIMVMVGPVGLMGQDPDEAAAVSALLKYDMEDLESEEVERLSYLLRHPLKVNIESESALLQSGLFSRYQVASLLDYRRRNGTVMSMMELSAVDGFGDDYVSRVSPFISLLPPSVKTAASAEHELLLRSALKSKDGVIGYSYDVRYMIRLGSRMKAAVSLNRSSDASSAAPDILGGHLEWRSVRRPLMVILGDFNARFGQGMTLWNGMLMNSYDSPSVFMRRSSGLTSSNSLTGRYSYTGVAAALDMSSFTLSVMLAAPGIKHLRKAPDKLSLLPAINFTYKGRRGQAGLTHYVEFSRISSSPYIPAMKTAADVAWCLAGVDVFSEVVYDWGERSPAMSAGTVFPIGEAVDAAAMMKLTNEELGLSMSGSVQTGRWLDTYGTGGRQRRVDGDFSAHMTLYKVPKTKDQDRSLQIKLRSRWKFILSESFAVSLRVTERMRSWGIRFRTDIRTDLEWNSERFSALLRLNALKCKKTGFLAYADGGLRSDRISLHLRQGVFLIDDWEDRIYVYERDVPGSFNVPAFYGRGLWTSILLAWKPARLIKIYFRAGYTACPFMKEKKPGRAELRLQCLFRF